MLQRIQWDVPNQRIVLAAGIVVLMISLSLSPLHHSEDLQKQNISMGQFGGGGTFEAQCSQSSFEDVFAYTWAEFNVTVADNWRTAQINASGRTSIPIANAPSGFKVYCVAGFPRMPVFCPIARRSPSSSKTSVMFDTA